MPQDNEQIETLRKDILSCPASYRRISHEAGFGGNGDSYVRKFATGEIEDLTTTRFFALRRAVTLLNE